MNSVLSAFKSSKSDWSIQSNKAKKEFSTNGGSYANLRHIREIGSSTKMNSFGGSSNDGEDTTLNLRLNRCSTLPFSTTKPIGSSQTTEQYIPQSKPSIISNEYEENHNSKLINHAKEHCSDISSNDFGTTHQTVPTSQNAISNNCVQNECADARNISSSSLESNKNYSSDIAYIPVLSAASAKKPYRSSESITTTNRSMSNRLANRLSLSSIANNPLPSVHGRSMNPQNVTTNSFCTGETKRTRISTHQRNLSLDFR